MNEVIKNMINRRSIRKYRDEQITDEQLDDILTAGEYAASGKGKQATMMFVVQDPETIALMSRINAQILGYRAGDLPDPPARKEGRIIRP